MKQDAVHAPLVHKLSKGFNSEVGSTQFVRAIVPRSLRTSRILPLSGASPRCSSATALLLLGRLALFGPQRGAHAHGRRHRAQAQPAAHHGEQRPLRRATVSAAIQP
jgi:hypothetical protein